MPRWDLVALSVWIFIVGFICFTIVALVQLAEWLA
jgi:hypothetical protein